MSQKLVLASKNKGKLREIKRLLPQGIEVLLLSDFGDIPSAEETGQTFLENAYQKASFYSSLLKLPVISEDSGLCVEALGGEPGVFSARFAGQNASDEENVKKLISKLRKLGLSSSPAEFVSFAFLAFPDGKGLWSEGRLKGKVITEPRGKGGFGYDPIFIPEGFSKTLAELSVEQKNRISHRGKAFERLSGIISKIFSLKE